MKYACTVSQDVDFLNPIDPEGINPQAIEVPSMGGDARGGITSTGTVNGSPEATRLRMRRKSVEANCRRIDLRADSAAATASSRHRPDRREPARRWRVQGQSD